MLLETLRLLYYMNPVDEMWSPPLPFDGSVQGKARGLGHLNKE